MLTEKYRPRKLSDIIGQARAVREFVAAIENWRPGTGIIVSGPVGCGKTSLVLAAASDLDFDIVEIDTSDERTGENIKKYMEPASVMGTLSGRKRILFIDDADLIIERGGLNEVKKLIEISRFPVVLTAAEPYRLGEIRSLCREVKLTRVRKNEIFKRLAYIAQQEGIDVDENTLRQIADISDGDLRSAINDLEALAGGFRERELNVFDTLKLLFKTRSLRAAREAILRSDKTVDELIYWVSENLWKEYETPEERKKAYKLLALSDFFRSMVVKNQNFRLLVYSTELLAAICLVKKEAYRKFVSYSPPRRPPKKPLPIGGRDSEAKMRPLIGYLEIISKSS
ncbi:MAG: AAA family ATPase [Candidatus Micrarchaeota archaeon]|nr:AAA family ATPase [Candidatus Micrarchaeota archaeon]